MEGAPVVDVVEVDSAGIAGAIIRETNGVEDAFAGIVAVAVAEDGLVVAVDVGLAEFDAGIGFHPGFALRVGGLAVFDEGVEVVPRDAEGVGGHFVVAAADGVVGVDLAGGVEGGLQPDAWQVKNAEGTGGAGGDHGDDLAHGRVGGVVWVGASEWGAREPDCLKLQVCKQAFLWGDFGGLGTSGGAVLLRLGGKFGVVGAGFEQLGVGATGEEAALAQDVNDVSVDDGGESMGDDEAGAIPLQGFESLLDEVFRLVVDCGGGFVEKEDRSVLQEGAGDGDALAFATA